MFQNNASAIPWSQFPTHRYWGTEFEIESPNPPTNDNIKDASPFETSQTILRFGNGSPAIVEKMIGKGRVMMWTTPITEPVRPKERSRWNDITIGNCWPYFAIQLKMSEYLVSGRASTLNYLVGQTAVLKNDPEKLPSVYRLFTPRGGDPTQILTNEGELRYRFTNWPGAYRLKGQFDGPVVRGFSVGLPPEITDLQRISSEKLDQLLGENNYQVAQEKKEIVRKQSAMRVGTEFYPILMLLLTAIFAIEHLVFQPFLFLIIAHKIQN